MTKIRDKIVTGINGRNSVNQLVFDCKCEHNHSLELTYQQLEGGYICSKCYPRDTIDENIIGKRFGSTKVVSYYGRSFEDKHEWLAECKRCNHTFACTMKLLRNLPDSHCPFCWCDKSNSKVA